MQKKQEQLDLKSAELRVVEAAAGRPAACEGPKRRSARGDARSAERGVPAALKLGRATPVGGGIAQCACGAEAGSRDACGTRHTA